ncbi:RNA-directed DNA polymerase, eukaryota, reverse transcriptase zinc-binding domain protein [Tanacetum coccineum]
MGNVSQKRDDSNDFDELEAFRVRPDEIVDKIGKKGENNVDEVKDGIEGGDEAVSKNSGVPGIMKNNVEEDSKENDMSKVEGVFGSEDSRKGQKEGDESNVSDCERRIPVKPNPVNTGIPDTITDFPKDVNVTPDCNAVDQENSNNGIRKKSYANKLSSGINDKDNELFLIPTSMKENGEKVVVFDKEIIKKGSEKWKFTVCGYFVGYKVGVNELKYNTRRMWGRFGLKDSVVDAEGMCYFKFKHEEGMNYVIDQSLWLVNGKPLLVQKWDPETVITKESPCKIPIWIRLLNVPLEAWSVRGISALASRLGRPIKMDQITTDICKTGTGRLGYARVLIKIRVEDEFIDKIEVNYVDEMKKVKSTKWVRVEYTWKPDRCSHCKVFGHSVMRCDAKPKLAPSNNIRVGKPRTANQEGFVEVRHKKNHNGIKKVWNNDSQGFKKQPSGVNMEFRPKEPMVKPVVNKQKKQDNEVGNPGVRTPPKAWNVGKENVKELRKSANKYVVLSEEENHNDKDPFIDKRLIEAIERKDVKMSDEEDVYDIDDQATQSFTANEIVENRSERRELWNALNLHRSIVNNKAWVIMGDFNVTLKPAEHSNGPSCMTIDMNEFYDAVNKIGWRIYVALDFNLLGQISYHSSAIMSIPKGIPKKKKSFRFANYVADKEEFLDIVKEGWRHEIRGCHMYKVVQRLKLLKKPLNNLNWQNGNIFDRTNILKEKLNEAHDKVDSDPFNLAKKQAAVNLLNDYTKAAEEELKLLHQKAKVKWLREGDKNSAYFHNIIKARKNKSRIESICCENESRVEGKLVNDQFVKHFQNFLGTTFHVSPLHSMGDIVKLKLSEAEALDMIIETSDEEIKEALFDINSSKAVGPGKILGEINATLIALVPKMDTPNKNGLSKVVSLNQSAFIPERHIQEKILITQELLKGYNRKNRAKRYAIKIDIHKAYDTISWDFLKEVMLMVGFHETMVNWIMTCITSASFSICVNGEVNRFFKGGRGLRQGDPISPYLFTLVIKAFNMIMIKNISESGKFKYHYGCKELKLTHMCFADDLMILCNGDTESLKVVKKSLDDFSGVSGLFPNLSKSTIFFGSISESLKEEMLQILPFKCGKLPIKYLGVPLLAKRLGVKDCQSLIDSVRNMINCWRNKFLSYAERIQLIASVLSAMHQYWASVYMLPIAVTNEIKKLFKSFLCYPGGSTRVKLKGKSIWEADIESNDSHGWKELIRIRDKIKPYVRFRIGDGKSISIWHDKWCDQGLLDKIINNRDIYDVRMSNETCLADAIKVANGNGQMNGVLNFLNYVKLKFLDYPLEKIKQAGLVKEIRLWNILLIILG